MKKNLTNDQISFVRANYPNKTLKDIHNILELDMSYKYFCLIISNLSISYGSKGNTPTTYRPKVKYKLDESYFENDSLECYYWAGFIAADGCVYKNSALKIELQSSDSSHLEKFKNSIKTDSPVKFYTSSAGYTACVLRVLSVRICESLIKKFNITVRKSLSLKPPYIENIHYKDAFILGAIDGDGTVALFNSAKLKQKYMAISFASGSKEFAEFVAARFSEIVGRDISVYKAKDNLFSIVVSDKTARTLFLHFYKINVPKLTRKWSEEKVEHCLSYRKYVDKERHNAIIDMLDSRTSIKDVASRLEVSYQGIYYWISKYGREKL